MKPLIFRLAGIALAFLCVAAPAAVSPALAQVPASKTEALTPVDRILLAERMARYARETNDAEAMVIASRMLHDTRISQADFGGVVTGGGPAVFAPIGAAIPSAETYLAEARLLAANKPEATAMVTAEQVRQGSVTRKAGAVGGALYVPKVLSPGAKWTFDVAVEAGKPMSVAAIGDGDADVNISVFDVAGGLVGRDTSPDYQAWVRWVPKAASRFRIEVQNSGPVNTYMVLYTN